VREILVVKTASIGIERFRRNAENLWPGCPEAIDDGELALTGIGFRAGLIELYRTTRLHPAGR
jgi:hypothetical protein